MSKLVQPAYTIPDDYTLPELKEGLPITREHYSFDERVMLMLADWYPGRSPHHLRAGALDIYLLSGYQPFTTPEPTQFTADQTVKLLMQEKMLGDTDERSLC